MQTTKEDERRAMVTKLTGEPWFYTVAEAQRAIADGMAELILTSAIKGRSDFLEARSRCVEEWNNLHGITAEPVGETGVSVGGSPADIERLMFGPNPAFTNTVKPIQLSADTVAETITEAQAKAFTHGILPALSLGALEAPMVPPPVPPAPVAQNSEPKPVRYFVCTTCGGAFAGTADMFRKCECGAAQFGNDQSEPFTEMGIPLCTSAAFEITALVESGKFNTATLSDGKTIIAVVNRNKRNVEQSLSDTLRTCAANARGSLVPVVAYFEEAASRGARTELHAHYHTRGCGSEKGHDGYYLRKEVTGDVRFFGQVIVRKEENEADGSLIFVPVFNCARCGSNHPNKVAFWKLTRPVCEWVDQNTPGKTVATHFAYCPTTGEPILMISSEPQEPIDYSTPAESGEAEGGKDVNTIDGPKPIESAPIPGPKPLGGVLGSSAYQEGYQAGLNSPDPINPFRYNTSEYEDYRRGVVDGRGVSRGE
jgi:hypothetical protein